MTLVFTSVILMKLPSNITLIEIVLYTILTSYNQIYNIIQGYKVQNCI